MVSLLTLEPFPGPTCPRGHQLPPSKLLCVLFLLPGQRGPSRFALETAASSERHPRSGSDGLTELPSPGPTRHFNTVTLTPTADLSDNVNTYVSHSEMRSGWCYHCFCSHCYRCYYCHHNCDIIVTSTTTNKNKKIFNTSLFA